MGAALLAVGSLFLLGGETRMTANEKGVMEALTILTNPDFGTQLFLPCLSLS